MYNHDYSASAQNKTTLQANALLKMVALHIDPPSGLAQASRDVSGRPTTYTYL